MSYLPETLAQLMERLSVLNLKGGNKMKANYDPKNPNPQPSEPKQPTPPPDPKDNPNYPR